MSETILVAGNAVAMAPLHAAVVEAFSDYLSGPFALTLDQFAVFLQRQAIDLPNSRIALQDGQIRAVAFASLRPDIKRWRLASLCAVKPARGTGVARLLMDDFIARASSSGACAVELECFAQNERAMLLYRRYGFESVCELQGWVPPTPLSASLNRTRTAASMDVLEVDRAAGFAWLRRAVRDIENLPLQVTAESLCANPAPLRFWQCGRAQLVFSLASDKPDKPVQIHSLVDPHAAQFDAQTLVEQLCIAHPAHEIGVLPQLHRSDLGGEALQRLGFTASPLHQLLMVRKL